MNRIGFGVIALALVAGCDGPKVVAKPILAVESTDPDGGAHVSVGLPDCRIRFDRALSPFSVSQSTIAVAPKTPFRATLIDDDTTLRMMFSDWLAPTTTYTITVSTDVMGVDRSRLDEPFVTTFVTGAPTRPVTIDSIAPASGTVGGGDPVALSGSGFEDPMSVLFGNVTAPDVTVVSTTELAVITPTGSRSGPVSVEVVRITDGASRILQDAFQFEPYPPPEMTSLAPVTGPEAGGQQVTIRASRLVPGSWAYFDGLPALAAEVRDDAGELVLDALTPPGVGQVDVIVRVPSGPETSAPLQYTYVPPPVVVGVTPGRGPATVVTVMPEIVVTGVDFADGAVVYFDGDLAPTSFESDTQLRATAVTGPSGAVDVVVENPDGQRAGLPGAYFRDPPPRIATLSPALGPITGGTPVDIFGANFMSTGAPPEVLLGTTAAVQVQFVDATHLLVVTPSFSAGGPQAVTVTNPDGQAATLAPGFGASPPPTITEISPRAVGATSQQAWLVPMTVEGTGFLEGAVLYLDGRPAAATEVDADANGTLLTAHIRGSATGFSSPGFVGVRVVNPDGQVVEVEEAVYGLEFIYKNCVPGGGWECTHMPASTTARQIEWIKIQDDLPLGAVIANASITVPNQLAVTGPNPDVPDPLHIWPMFCNEIVYDDTTNRLPDDTSDETFSVAVDDIDGDGDEDILFGNQRQSRILLNDGGTFDYPGFDFENSGLPRLGDTFRANDVELVDVTGEGRLDIIIAASESIDTFTNTLLINYGLGAAPNMFVDESSARLPAATSSVWRDGDAADLNGDNHPDLVFVGATGKTEVWLNGQDTGNWGYFTLDAAAIPAGTIAASENLRGVALGDVNADGDVDMLIAVSGGQNRLLAGAGDGTFTDATGLLPTHNDDSRDVEIADINLDGHVDLVFANFDTFNRVYYFFPAAGRFFDVTEGPTRSGSSWYSVVGAESATFMHRSVDWPTHDIDLRPFDGATCATDIRPDMAVAANGFVHVALSEYGCRALGTGGGPLLTWIATLGLLMTWRRRRRWLTWMLAVAALGCVGQGCGGEETTPCTVVSVAAVHPADGAWVSADTEVSVTYERAVRLNGASLEVTDVAGGGAVPGTVTAVDDIVTFSATGGLPAGRHFEARVTGDIEDTAGCAAELAPAWRFSVPALGQPTVTEINPNSGPRFGGTRIDISGGGFVHEMEVHFADTPAASVVLTDDTAMTVVTPPSDVVGWVPVRLAAPGATPVELTDAFEYFGIGVRVDDVSPPSGPAGGGTVVTLTGVGLDEVTAVRFRDASASVESQSELQLVVTTPPGIGPVAITLDTDDGMLLLPGAFTFLPAPVLHGIEPSSGPMSESTSGVMLSGVGIGDALLPPTIVVDGADLPATAVEAHANDLTSVTFTMPAGSAPGVAMVGARNPDGLLSSSLPFTRVAAPASPIATPPGSETSGGDLLVITCALAECAFQPGARIGFGSACLTTPSSCTQADLVTSTQLVTTSPPGGAGRIDLFVVNPDGQVSVAGDFYYFTRPTVSGVEPTWGPPEGGITVAVLGSGFLMSGTDEPIVFWDEQPLATQWISATELQATAPAHPQGLVHRIEVRNPDYGSAGIDRAFAYRHVRLSVETEVGAGLSDPSNTVAFAPFGDKVVRVNKDLSEPLQLLRPDALGYGLEPLCNTPTIPLPTGVARISSAYVVSSATSPSLMAGRLRGYNGTNDPADYGCGTTSGFVATWDDEPDLVPPLSGAATDVAVGDVTGDGLADIVVVYFDDLTESVLLEGTVGDFVQASPGPFAGRLESTLDVELSDLDGDGALDILCANLAADSLYRSNIGTGVPELDGGFMPPIESSNAIAAGDLDGDGDDDVLVASTGGLRIYANHAGALTEVDAWGYPSPGSDEATRVTTLDADADGTLDVFVAWTRTNVEYELYWGVGRGRARAATGDELDRSGFSPSDPVGALWTFDLSTDDDSDLLVGTENGADPLVLASRNPAPAVVDATDTFWVQPNRTAGSLLTAAAGDFDGDGDDEIGVSAVAWATAMSWLYRSAVLEIGGDGSLTPIGAAPVTSGFTGRWRAVAIAWNPDGDNDDDLLLVNDPSSAGGTNLQIGWHFSNSGLQPATLSSLSADSLQGPTGIVAGDVDGAGRGVFFVSNGAQQARLLAYDPATYAPKFLTVVPPLGVTAADFADLTGDGAEELIAIGSGGALGIYTLAVDDLLDELVATEITGILPNLGPGTSVTAADIDGDDDVDLLLGDILRVSLLENVDGSFALNPLRFVADRAHAVTALRAVDLDRDGDLDVLAQSWGFWKAFLSEGDGWFREETRQLTPHGDRWKNQWMVIAHPADGPPRIYSHIAASSVLMWHHTTLP